MSLAAAAAVVLAGGSALADATAPSAVANPAGNVSLPVDYWPACWPDASTAACRDAVVTDIDYARSLEAVAPIMLPTGFDQMDPGVQTFVVTNLERVDRGLRPIAGIAADLSATAQGAATALTDPQFTGSSVGPLAAGWWTGIWANTPNALIADLLWMYQDGWAGSDTTNRDCTSPDAAGCWGHRENILSNYGGTPQLVAGVGSSSNWGVSIAEVVVGGYGDLPPLTYAWPQPAPATAATTAVPRTTKPAVKHASRQHKHKKHRVARKHRRRTRAATTR